MSNAEKTPVSKRKTKRSRTASEPAVSFPVTDSVTLGKRSIRVLTAKQEIVELREEVLTAYRELSRIANEETQLRHQLEAKEAVLANVEERYASEVESIRTRLRAVSAELEMTRAELVQANESNLSLAQERDTALAAERRAERLSDALREKLISSPSQEQ